MRYARRLIAALVGVAFWGVATTLDAFALQLPDPPGVSGFAPPASSAAGTPLWHFALFAAITALMVVAVVGLIASLRHARPSSRPSQRLHA
jgi:hypothetical protein